MSQRAIGVTDVASGAGVADFRTRERTVSAVTVVEQYLLLQEERVGAQFMAASFRTAANATTAQNYAAIYNPTGSGVLVGVNVVGLERDAVGNSTATAPPVPTVWRLSRVAQAGISGGTTGTAVSFDGASSAAAVIKWSTASDGGAQTAITATPGNPGWQEFITHWHAAGASVVEQFKNDTVDFIVDGEVAVLAEGDGLVLSVVTTTGGSSDNNGQQSIINLAWKEFTLP